ncbi:type I-E CRISPR-associated protein Cse1/CasA [Methylococcus sp. ANG]|uniref:type I-E CRISPR-associated protein Cse1/CasA n=1 Tax=Methylococcus sp. ANG TaxID=3231903 RepID=UPI00345AE2D1
MNLLSDWNWLPVTRGTNEREAVEPWQITQGIGNRPILDVLAPRADFKGALYQFLIGLLQTAFAPEDEIAWRALWEKPPAPEILKAAFEPYLPAFELGGSGPAFMQDFDLSEGEPKEIAALLIEAPGGKTLRENLDHFVKGGTVQRMAPEWAVMALFTLQINAPSGGVGHRVGLRGGGPLTTLVLPDETDGPASLWHTLWLNVLTQEELALQTGNAKLSELAAIFPWLAPSRTSEAKTGAETQPHDGHPLQMYWAMPRRIRLDFANAEPGYCDLSGKYSERLIGGYVTKNYGVNYTGPWQHPLTPYSIDPKTGPLSIKGQPGGVCYRHWLGLVLDGGENSQRHPAQVVNTYLKSRQGLMTGDYQPRLWAFGYDMDNMKARCWYEATMPVFPFDWEKRESIQGAVQILLDAAAEALGTMRSCLKEAWFSRPKDAKGDFSFVDREFWQSTEADFYRALAEIAEDQTGADKGLREAWRRCLVRHALGIFDHWALSESNEDGDMKRLVLARGRLLGGLKGGKQMKKLAA